MFTKSPFSTACLIWCTLLLLELVQGHEQIYIHHKRNKPHKISLGFDDLPTGKDGIGYHPEGPKQPALHYKSLYLQGFSVVNVAESTLEDPSDLVCAHSAPNALFGKVTEGLPWPRISLADLSRPFHRPSDDGKPKPQSTFSLVKLHIKPTGNSPGEPGKGFVVVSVNMFKLPPDPLQGHIGDGTTAGDVFPGVVRGGPVTTPYTYAGLYMVFAAGPISHSEGFAPREWFGEDWGRGVDVMEFTAMSMVLVNETTNDWRQEPWGICVDDLVVEVVKADDEKDNLNLVDDDDDKNEISGVSEGHEHESWIDGSQADGLARYVFVKEDGALAKEGDPQWQLLQEVVRARTLNQQFF